MATQSDILTFNVQTENLFILVSGTTSITDPQKYTIVPNDTFIYPSTDDIVENLDPEFIESGFIGQEELPVLFDCNVISPDVNLKMMGEGVRFDPNLPGGGNINGDIGVSINTKSSGYGTLKSGLSDRSLLDLMVGYIEGGYYYPAHSKNWSSKDKNLYSNSGETLWGIDRCAGNTEGLQGSGVGNKLGIKFWSTIDSLSGYGSNAGYSRSTRTGAWDYSKNDIKETAWKYGFIPSTKNIPSDKYNILLESFTKYAVSHLNSYLNSNFGNHPVKSLILSDSRLKFLWLRATWNGPGWFKWYSNGKGSIHSTKWAYENGYNTADSIIIWELNNRLQFNTTLITHDVKRIAELIGAKNSSSV